MPEYFVLLACLLVRAQAGQERSGLVKLKGDTEVCTLTPAEISALRQGEPHSHCCKITAAQARPHLHDSRTYARCSGLLRRLAAAGMVHVHRPDRPRAGWGCGLRGAAASVTEHSPRILNI